MKKKPVAQGGYDKEAWMANLDKAIENESKNSSYKSSKKAPVNQLQQFENRLDLAMKAEAENSSYKPSMRPSQKKSPQVDPNKEFENRLNAAMKAESENSSYKPSQKKDPKAKKMKELIITNNLKID